MPPERVLALLKTWKISDKETNLFPTQICIFIFGTQLEPEMRFFRTGNQGHLRVALQRDEREKTAPAKLHLGAKEY